VACTMDPSNGLITCTLVEEMGDERGLRVFLEHVYFEDNVLEFNWIVQNRLPVGLLSEVTGSKLERAPRYRELPAPAGLGYELRGEFSTGTQAGGPSSNSSTSTPSSPRAACNALDSSVLEREVWQ
jgi:hypothetical protein